MGRIVGDGALNFEIVDVAVDPEHQGKGLGRKIMEALLSWLEQQAPVGAYITLIALRRKTDIKYQSAFCLAVGFCAYNEVTVLKDRNPQWLCERLMICTKK